MIGQVEKKAESGFELGFQNFIHVGLKKVISGIIAVYLNFKNLK